MAESYTPFKLKFVRWEVVSQDTVKNDTLYFRFVCNESLGDCSVYLKDVPQDAWPTLPSTAQFMSDTKP